MSDNEKLLGHARRLVGLLENPEPGLITWQIAVESSLEGIVLEAGLQVVSAPDPKIDQATCPHCGAQPLRFNMQQGPVPMGEAQLLIAQAWCSGCKRQLAMQIMGVLAPGATPDPSADFGGERKPKLWSPS